MTTERDIKDRLSKWTRKWMAVKKQSRVGEHPITKNEDNKYTQAICLLDSIEYDSHSPDHLHVMLHDIAADGNLLEFEKLYKNDTSCLNVKDCKGRAPIHHAVLKDRLNIIIFILSHNGDVNIQDREGNTALHLAVAEEKTMIMDILLKNKADPNITNKQNMAPIHVTIMNDKTEALKVLLTYDGVSMMGGLHEGHALHWCACKDQVDCAKILLENGAVLTTRCGHGFTPVHVAAKFAGHKCLELFTNDACLCGMTRDNVTHLEDKEKNTPLHAAVNSGDLKGVEILLNAGAPVDAQQVDKSTALHFACAQGSMRMVQLMYEKQLDGFMDALTIKDALDMVPLHRAAQYNHVEVVKYLLEKGADCNSIDKENRTPMLLAASKSGTETVRVLLKHGADLNITDVHNRNFLHLAIKSGGITSVGEPNTVCLSFMTMLNAQDDFGCTPLHYATRAGHLGTTEELIKLGALINPKNKDNKSPFHFATRYGRYNTCLKLLNSAYGAIIINETDGNARTGLHIAAENGHYKIVSLLLERGAVVTRDDKSNAPIHLAAANGYTKCIKLLLKFHKNLLDAQNQFGDTPLHTAAHNGQLTAVNQLMSYGAKFAVNKDGHTFLECAIDNMQIDVALEIIRHDRWEEVLSMKSKMFGCPVLGMVQLMPEVCMAVLDRCRVPSNHDPHSKEYHVKYNFKYLQCPLPVAKELEKKGENIMPMITLNRMVEYGRVNCLSHPVSVMYLRMKWKAYGCFLYMFNFVIYIIFLAMLTYFGLSCDDHEQNTTAIITLNDTTSAPVEKNFNELYGSMQKASLVVLSVFCALNFLKEFFQMYQQKLKYFFDATNLLEWVLYISASIFIFPMFIGQSTDLQWSAAAIAMFLAWINCLLYLQRFDFFGLYVVMFLEILSTLLQVVFVFSIMFVAFGLSFYILLSKEETEAFSTPTLSIIKSVVMMMELDYMDSFNKPLNDDDPSTLHYDTLSMILLILFILLMPILLVNLLIGLAVGDIESVQRNAKLKRLAMQVELHTEFERKLPFKFLEKVDKVTYIVYQNKCQGFLHNMMDRLTAATGNSDLTAGGASPENQFIMEELYKQKRKMKDMSQSMNKQHDLLRLIVQKMEIRTEDDDQDEGGSSSEDLKLLTPRCNSALRRGMLKQDVVSKWKDSMD